MSGKGRKPDAGGRSVTADETELWTSLMQRVDPLRAKKRVAEHAAPAEPPAASVRVKASPPQAKSSTPKASLVASSATREGSAPPLADLDRRTVRQISSGKIGIDSVIDLHGQRQVEARASLRAFLFSAHAAGLRTVLVITGKGGERERGDMAGDRVERGVLRRSVPLWLELVEFRSIVLGYTSAGPRHGGDGALYVQLRKRRTG